MKFKIGDYVTCVGRGNEVFEITNVCTKTKYAGLSTANGECLKDNYLGNLTKVDSNDVLIGETIIRKGFDLRIRKTTYRWWIEDERC